MRKYIPHIFVAATLHIVALMVAHKIAVEIIEVEFAMNSMSPWLRRWRRFDY